MTIMPISGISSMGDGSPQQQSVMQQDLKAMQNSSPASGSDTLQLQTNGVRASASDNPQSTLRLDREALQSAINSQDLSAEQQSLLRIIADTQQIDAAQKAAPTQPLSALPKPAQGALDGGNPDEGDGPQTGQLIDVTA